MLNAVNLTLVAFSQHFGRVDGQILVFFVMSVAAAEAAVGLAIVIALFRNKLTINVDEHPPVQRVEARGMRPSRSAFPRAPSPLP